MRKRISLKTHPWRNDLASISNPNIYTASTVVNCAMPYININVGNIMSKHINTHLSIVLLSVFFSGCSTNHKPDWQVKELERRAGVRAIVKQIAEDPFEDDRLVYTELRDVLVRKRDIPEMTKKIAQMANPEAKMVLLEVIQFKEGSWRLPTRGWTGDVAECNETYAKEFSDRGCIAVVSETGYPPNKMLELEILDFPAEAEKRDDVVNLILTLEPQSLRLWGAWKNISFVGSLLNLEELTLTSTLVNDFSPLRGLPALKRLNLVDGTVSDLTTLRNLPSLRVLSIDQTPLSDLTIVKEFPDIRELYLLNTPVADLTPLEDLPSLETIHVEKTKVKDLTPLRSLPRLKYLYIQDGLDLTPLEGSSVFIVRKKSEPK
jgi:hypothetical protein